MPLNKFKSCNLVNEDFFLKNYERCLSYKGISIVRPFLKEASGILANLVCNISNLSVTLGFLILVKLQS